MTNTIKQTLLTDNATFKQNLNLFNKNELKQKDLFNLLVASAFHHLATHYNTQPLADIMNSHASASYKKAVIEFLKSIDLQLKPVKDTIAFIKENDKITAKDKATLATLTDDYLSTLKVLDLEIKITAKDWNLEQTINGLVYKVLREQGISKKDATGADIATAKKAITQALASI